MLIGNILEDVSFLPLTNASWFLIMFKVVVFALEIEYKPCTHISSVSPAHLW